MSIIRDYIEKCVASEPVFTLEVNMGVVMGHHKQATQPAISDPIWDIVVHNFEEFFSSSDKRFMVNKDSMYRNVRQTILNQVASFYCSHCGMKAPYQTKLYKWLRRYGDTDMLVLLHRYIVSFCGPSMKTVSNDPNTKNVLAILEYLRSKDEK